MGVGGYNGIFTKFAKAIFAFGVIVGFVVPTVLWAIAWVFEHHLVITWTK